jgi:SAM-dependent methyltransferase
LAVNRTIDDKDGMSKGMIDYYFVTGMSAMVAINKSLAAAGKSEADVRRVLDYACRYGRVLRWLMAGFPQASVIGVDVDAKAVASARETLGADTRVLDLTLAKPIDAPVDLIWVGSLFTHLSEHESGRVLNYLHDHLDPGGLVVLTTHGALVENRLRNRERTYGLDEAGVVELLKTYDDTGFGFAPYPKSKDYGISLSSEEKIAELADDAGYELVFCGPAGWVKHQDVVALVRPS